MKLRLHGVEILQLFCLSDFPFRSILTDFKVSKTAILTNVEVLNFDFSAFLQFLKAQFYQNSKSRVSKTVKMVVFETQILPKIDFT